MICECNKHAFLCSIHSAAQSFSITSTTATHSVGKPEALHEQLPARCTRGERNLKTAVRADEASLRVSRDASTCRTYKSCFVDVSVANFVQFIRLSIVAVMLLVPRTAIEGLPSIEKINTYMSCNSLYEHLLIVIASSGSDASRGSATQRHAHAGWIAT